MALGLIDRLAHKGRVVEKGHGVRTLVLADITSEDVPTTPTAQVRLQLGEVCAGACTDVHVHQGATFFLLLSGDVQLEQLGLIERYEPGDCFSSPVGIPHRDVNPRDDRALVAVSLFLTPPGRAHIVSETEFPLVRDQVVEAP